MNWEAIGALGEIIGALAVFATLLYVAVQARHTRVAVEHTGGIATAEAHSRVRLMLAHDAELAALLAKADSGETLTDGERIQLKNLYMDRFVAAGVGEWTATSGADHFEADYLVDFLRDHPAAIEEWRRQRALTGSWAPGLSAKVDAWIGTNSKGHESGGSDESSS